MELPGFNLDGSGHLSISLFIHLHTYNSLGYCLMERRLNIVCIYMDGAQTWNRKGIAGQHLDELTELHGDFEWHPPVLCLTPAKAIKHWPDIWASKRTPLSHILRTATSITNKSATLHNVGWVHDHFKQMSFLRPNPIYAFIHFLKMLYPLTHCGNEDGNPDSFCIYKFSSTSVLGPETSHTLWTEMPSS